MGPLEFFSLLPFGIPHVPDKEPLQIGGVHPAVRAGPKATGLFVADGTDLLFYP